MSWKDQLRPASFRGVEFHVEYDYGTFGRRTVPHEYPYRDKPFVEDMGRAARRMRINAIILGADYMAQRDALIAAVETAGPGKLVHPQFGEMQVSVIDDGLTIDHSTTEGGSCRVSFSCIESGDITFPAATSATTTVVTTQAAAAQETLSDTFAGGFSLDGLQSFGVTDAIERAGRWLDTVEGQVGNLAAGATTPLAALASAFASARGSINALLNAPANFASTVTSLLGGISDALEPRDAVRLLTDLVGFGDDETVIRSTTATREAMADNRTAFLELTRGSATAEAAATLTEVEFSDYDDAAALRDRVTDAIDTVADSAQGDDVYQALTTLRAAVVRDVATRGADLARIVKVTPATTLPALVLAYRLYGDAAYDLDLVARNAATIVRPGFVPGGQQLEVAIDG
ncbi:DNA circularization N-terminal domain-containing protein [Stenotrophomonas sp. MMGLT7]|uniref:DNA circularization protein n=1 Tax=Stenotrophomonas sp. MMGLT7 TaxID=2901227 RepID=UPI001E4D2D97|nr:DNA circularization N-terminal domain-containing protein [Stenotrophomonas sp. MMGLT7]MCD7099123.1 DNA circularization N-terminal domain-containing protein [Stenotrophomonas sp. MMGLT7]